MRRLIVVLGMIALWIVVSQCLWPRVARAGVSVDAWSLTTLASNARGAVAEDRQLADASTVSNFDPNLLLVRLVIDGAADLAARAQTAYVFDVVGDTALFVFNFDHERPGRKGSDARSTGSLLFSVTDDADLSYRIDGNYDLTSGAKLIGFDLLLADMSPDPGADPVLYADQQRSTLASPSLQIADAAPSTSLEAGHTYLLKYGFFVTRPTNTRDNGAAAAGEFQLKIFNPAPPPPPPPPPPMTAIPNPLAVWMGLALLGGAGLLAKLRRRFT